MSMVVAFTITPWLAFHVLKKTVKGGQAGGGHDPSPDDIKRSLTYRIFEPLMAPMLHRRWVAWAFLGFVGLLMLGASLMPMLRLVPLKMLPFDNKNELQLVIDLPRGSHLNHLYPHKHLLQLCLRNHPPLPVLVNHSVH